MDDVCSELGVGTGSCSDKSSSGSFSTLNNMTPTLESKGTYSLGEKIGNIMPEKSSKAVSIHCSTLGDGVEDGCVSIRGHRVRCAETKKATTRIMVRLIEIVARSFVPPTTDITDRQRAYISKAPYQTRS